MNETCPPISSKSAKGMNHTAVCELFRKAGFGNIKEEAIPDIGMFGKNKIETVSQVEINGETGYKIRKPIRVDASILIKYHIKKNK
jgi:hypothetical protein